MQKLDIFNEFDDDLCDVSDDCLSDKDKHIIYPNKGEYGHLFSSYDTTILPLDLKDMEKYTLLFKNDFSKHISKIEGFYGKENVTIKWGVIAYAS